VAAPAYPTVAGITSKPAAGGGRACAPSISKGRNARLLRGGFHPGSLSGTFRLLLFGLTFCHILGAVACRPNSVLDNILIMCILISSLRDQTRRRNWIWGNQGNAQTSNYIHDKKASYGRYLMTDQKYKLLNLNNLIGLLPGRRALERKVPNLKVCLTMLLKTHVDNVSPFGPFNYIYENKRLMAI
jgi:hypothetical protein